MTPQEAEPHDVPRDPIAAATHRDPYPYYARLTAERPFHRDPTLGLWVAASAAAVTAVLTSDLCRVRPPAEPVPKALLGTPAAEVFGGLVRMNDGGRHAPLKRAVSAALASLDLEEAAAAGRDRARDLVAELRPERDPERLQELAFRLPAAVVAHLLGVPPDLQESAARWTGDLAVSFTPSATPEQIERGAAAATELRRALASVPDGGLLGSLSHHAREAGCEPDAVLANAVGFLTQSYEATAGLIGNTLLALARFPEIRGQVRADSGRLGAVIEEVLRWDPPVQNTRRFVARAGTLAGHEVREGDAVLVLLAAANRDPAAFRDPHRFDPDRPDRPSFTFGAGPHACPGSALATVLARAGVEAVLAAGLDPAPLAADVNYRPAANVRIPLFGNRLTSSPPSHSTK